MKPFRDHVAIDGGGIKGVILPARLFDAIANMCYTLHSLAIML
jgi:hypothetical protein